MARMQKDITPQPDLIPLGDGALAHLPQGVEGPTYDRAALSVGIVHIGVGNFHRAHQAWYLHRLMQRGDGMDWAILGAGVRAGDAVMRDKLLGQDCLTTLIELRPDGMSAEVTGSMTGFLPVEPDNGPLIAQLALPSTRIVSLTVTEGGYYLNPADGSFDASHPEMVYDAAHPDRPRSAFGAIVAALSLRRAAGTGPFTVQSCDNLQGNGAVARATTVALARLSDPSLADWIDAQCTFPNSMVDCIVPATGSAEIALAHGLGLNDAAPVTHENFRQWVIEDRFCAGRPNWDRVGATFTDNVHAYEAMKIRVLNAGHQVLANAGELLSVDTIADCMAHPAIAALFAKVQGEEIVPYVDPLPGMTPAQYVRLIETRFANPAIHDTTRRVAFDGWSRHTGFVLPIVKDALAAGGPVEGLALVEALWARMCAGLREDGSAIAPNDPQWQTLHAAALQAKDIPQAWLAQAAIYGPLAQDARFAGAFLRWLDMIWTKGTLASLQHYAEQT